MQGIGVVRRGIVIMMVTGLMMVRVIMGKLMVARAFVRF